MDGGVHLRVVRSAVFAGLAVALSAGGRQAVTGEAAPVPAVLGAFAVVFGLALLLASGERGYFSIAALLVPLELGLNAAFNLADAARDGCPPGGWPGAVICGGGTARPGLAGTAGAPLAGHQLLVLLLANLALVLVVALWLRRGEIAVFEILRVVAALAWTGCAALLARLIAAPAPPVAPAWVAPPDGPPPARPQDVHLGSAPRRGPPVPSLV